MKDNRKAIREAICFLRSLDARKARNLVVSIMVIYTLPFIILGSYSLFVAPADPCVVCFYIAHAVLCCAQLTVLAVFSVGWSLFFLLAFTVIYYFFANLLVSIIFFFIGGLLIISYAYAGLSLLSGEGKLRYVVLGLAATAFICLIILFSAFLCSTALAKELVGIWPHPLS